ncbi:MAG: hypothetical protein HKM87_10745 [Ignavibacteriaceae bacterium]|nr:hypothetical protein [Ignavibacteriaceae bacterium]
MKSINKIIILAFISFLVLVSCNSTSTESKMGIISVSVVDNDANKTPVPNIDITITPINIVQKTDLNGITNFEVEPGNYFVDAQVCCLGPGFIVYHVPVQVNEDRTSNIELEACLSCD